MTLISQAPPPYSNKLLELEMSHLLMGSVFFVVFRLPPRLWAVSFSWASSCGGSGLQAQCSGGLLWVWALLGCKSPMLQKQQSASRPRFWWGSSLLPISPSLSPGLLIASRGHQVRVCLWGFVQFPLPAGLIPGHPHCLLPRILNSRLKSIPSACPVTTIALPSLSLSFLHTSHATCQYSVLIYVEREGLLGTSLSSDV